MSAVPTSLRNFVGNDDTQQNIDELKSRFQEFNAIDPFPEVPPALLNSSDIFDYVRVTGMVWPFESDPEKLKEKLKVASYEVDFLGDVYWYPDDQIKHETTKIERDSVFVLKKNSIAFVHLKTLFHLPYYIALRFNLRITHVHRGLLLGTGPLVDPGFGGRLLVPLHNLTSEDYALIGGEGLIWVEFTKVSPHVKWDGGARIPTRDTIAFESRKMFVDAQRYFNKASQGKPAKSSIPGELKKATESAEKTEKKLNLLTWGAIVTIALTVVALVSGTWSLISDANKNVADSSKNISDFRKTVDDMDKTIEKLRSTIKSLQERLDAAETAKAKSSKKQ